MGINQKATASSLAKLSSGLKINSAADDAAGLSISEKMRGQISGLNTASANAQTGINMVSTAEGALNETTAVLQRMRELAVQAGSDTNTTSDRAAMQTETSQLVNAINDIGNNTQFNTKNLLNGSVGVQMSSSTTALSAATTGASTQSGVYLTNVVAVATQAKLGGAQDFAVPVSSGSVTINGSQISITVGDTIGTVASKINNMSSATGVTAIIQQGSSAGTQKLIIQSNNYGSNSTISATGDTHATFAALGLTTTTGTVVTASAAGTDVAGNIEGSTATGNGLSLTSTGANSKGLVVNTVATQSAATSVGGAYSTPTVAGGTIIINGYTAYTATIGDSATNVVAALNAASKETGVTASLTTGGTINLASMVQGKNASITVGGTDVGVGLSGLTAATTNGSDALALSSGNITVNTSNVMQLQIGANQGQTMAIGIDDMRATALGVNNIDLTTQAGAAVAITSIDAATAKVSSERSNLGAFQNRLEHTINNLGTASQNITASEASIRDVDMAAEMTNFQKNNILQQAAQAMLAQANQQPQGVLQLLR